MAIVKLVCQGCGANLDVQDDQNIIACGYCGCSNKLQKAAAPIPTPRAPNPAPAYVPAAVPHSLPYQPAGTPLPAPAARSSKIALVIVLVAVLTPLLLGGAIVYMVAGVARSTITQTFDHLNQVAGVVGAEGLGNKFTWVSSRPHLADVDADGNEDLIGLIQPVGASQVQLVALTGASYGQAWTTELGARSDLPQVRLMLDAKHELALVLLGTSIRAYDLRSGQERWAANAPDKVESIVLDGEQLWVRSIDESLNTIAPANGKLEPAKGEPSQTAQALRDDGGYDLIPSFERLDLETKQFDGLEVERGFCSPEALVETRGRHGRTRAGCSNPNGLAFATRRKGTEVPFLLGYEGASKAERWRAQMTQPGSVETVESGFDQPRAEFVDGADAIVSFSPTKLEGVLIRRVSLADGETRWETTVASSMPTYINAIVVGKAAVFVSYGQSVHVLSLADGSEQTRIGGAF